MCGRFNLKLTPAELLEIFALIREFDFPPRYNIAPTQSVVTIRKSGIFREATAMHWGLIPSWAKDPSIGNRMINARAETIAEKPSFRNAFKKQRCLIPATGFYEWKKTGGKTKQPYHIGMNDGEPFAFAGLWESWQGGEQKTIESCTIITTEANRLLSDIHDRMPVILSEEDYDTWLDPKLKDAETLQELLNPLDPEAMRVYPVSTLVNSPRNDRPECMEEE